MRGNPSLSSLRLLLSSLCLLIFTCLIALADQPTLRKPYTLQTGDRIDVTVEGYPEYSKQIVLRLDGFISYPLIEETKAEGLTIPDLGEAIRKGLADRLDNPRVFVTLLQSRPRSVYVGGMVALPNQYFFDTEQIYLLQALTRAGGVDYERAKLTDIEIWRNGKIHQIVNLARLAHQTDIALQPDDLIYVPSLLQQRPIMVTGAVVKPDLYPIESPQIHALQVLMLAGGPMQDIANSARAQIIKSNGDRISVNLDVASGDEATIDAAMLGPGDTLYIPNAYEEDKVSIMGAVFRPGQYSIKEPVNMLEALALAGGWNEDKANLKKTLVIRSDGNREKINLLELLEAGHSQSAPLLYPGDQLQVPNRLRINWSAMLAVTSAATLIYNIVRR